MRQPSSVATSALLISPEIAPPALSAGLLRLHGTLTPRELWQALRSLVNEAIACTSLVLEIDRTDAGAGVRQFRHGHAGMPREDNGEASPAAAWLERHAGARAFRLSDIAALRELRLTPYFERVMRRESWDKQLGIVAWSGRFPRGRLLLHRGSDEPDFTSRDLRMAESLQPHLVAALERVLAHEDAVQTGAHVARMLEDAPFGLLLLDWDLRPLWYNREGAQACLVWCHGERRAAAMRPGHALRVPPALAAHCGELRTLWRDSTRADREGGLRPAMLSDDTLGVHAQVTLRLGPDPAGRPAFEVQLDYRRPRGDRGRPLSPGAVALLARLSPREREVAMRAREGLGTRAIAAELHRSPLTIKTQLASIFRKLEAQGRTRVAALLNR